MLCLIKCSLSLPDTTLSMTFEIHIKLDTGRKFFLDIALKVVKWVQFLSDLGIMESLEEKNIVYLICMNWNNL